MAGPIWARRLMDRLPKYTSEQRKRSAGKQQRPNTSQVARQGAQQIGRRLRRYARQKRFQGNYLEHAIAVLKYK